MKLKIKKYKKFEELTEKEKVTYLKMKMDEPYVSQTMRPFFMVIFLATVVLLIYTIDKLQFLFDTLKITYVPAQSTINFLNGFSQIMTIVFVLLVFYIIAMVYDSRKWTREFKGFRKSIERK